MLPQGPGEWWCGCSVHGHVCTKALFVFLCFVERCLTFLKQGVHIESISEPELCSYKMTVCVPQLCVDPNAVAEEEVASPPPSSDSSPGDSVASPSSGPTLRRMYALLWPAVVLTDGEPMWWVQAVEPMTALSH